MMFLLYAVFVSGIVGLVIQYFLPTQIDGGPFPTKLFSRVCPMF